MPGAFHLNITEQPIVQETIQNTIFENRGIGQPLGGRYWSEGEKVAPVGVDEVRSGPVEANLKRYSIGIIDQSTFGGGGWLMVGGMVGRIVRPQATIELFGRRVARVHGMKRTSTEQDSGYEFFLIVRPSATGVGRLVRQWRFAHEETIVEQYVPQ